MSSVTILMVSSCIVGFFISYFILKEISGLSSFLSSFESVYPKESDIVCIYCGKKTDEAE